MQVKKQQFEPYMEQWTGSKLGKEHIKAVCCEKAGLKLSIQKTKIMASGPITSWQIDGETMETVRDFIWGGNGTPLQYSCLENPMDRGAWWATVHGARRVGHD